TSAHLAAVGVASAQHQSDQALEPVGQFCQMPLCLAEVGEGATSDCDATFEVLRVNPRAPTTLLRDESGFGAGPDPCPPLFSARWGGGRRGRPPENPGGVVARFVPARDNPP